jgi:hypothetical protein
LPRERRREKQSGRGVTFPLPIIPSEGITHHQLTLSPPFSTVLVTWLSSEEHWHRLTRSFWDKSNVKH